MPDCGQCFYRSNDPKFTQVLFSFFYRSFPGSQRPASCNFEPDHGVNIKAPVDSLKQE